MDDSLLLAASQPWFVGLWGSVSSIVQVAIGLGFVIFVHELGHFLAAKFFGVKCEKFYIGFDVPIKIGPIRIASLAKARWGETEYGIGIIPLGGYVKMLGQDDDPRRAEEEAARIRKLDPSSTESAPKVVLDPRSFPAKPVYARMIIISAGVVMNLIFAVLMAAYAFRGGVPYQPTIIGGLSPGDPAWEAGFQPGDQILQVADMKKPDDNLQYTDMAEFVIISGLSDEKKKIPVVVRRNREETVYQLQGTKRHDPEGVRTMLGIKFAHSTQVRNDGQFLITEYDESPEGHFGLKNGDRIVSVDGVRLEIDDRSGAPADYSFWPLLNAKNDEPVVLGIERNKNAKETESLEVTFPPLALRTLGLKFPVDGISAVQVESPASKAGVGVGDQILSFNDQPIEDGLTLHLLVLKQVGKEVKAKLKKGNGDEIEVVWKVPQLPRVDEIGPQIAPVGYELYGSGMTYSVGNVISGFEAGSAAANSKLKVGDIVNQINVVPDPELKKKLLKAFRKEIFEPRPIDKNYSMIWANELIQAMPEGTPIKIYVERSKVIDDETLKLTLSDQWHQTGRGLLLEPMTLTHRTDSAVEALTLGVHETWKRMIGVGKFLKLLVSGRVPTRAVGGPGMIFYSASNAASEGISKLLMFLVMLSANLAILNFLPIPALDGGHMMFLTWEAATGKPVDENLQAKLTMCGVLALLALMAFVIFNDTMNIGRILGF